MNVKLKEAETEKLNKLCFFIWRFPFQGKPSVPEFYFNKKVQIDIEQRASEPSEK